MEATRPKVCADFGFPYFEVFQDRFTHVLDEHTEFEVTPDGRRYDEDIAPTLVPAQLELVDSEVLAWVLSQPKAFDCRALVAGPDSPFCKRPECVHRAVLWALRQGLVRLGACQTHR